MKYNERITEIALNPKYYPNVIMDSFDLQGVLVRGMTEDEISSHDEICIMYAEKDEKSDET